MQGSVIRSEQPSDVSEGVGISSLPGNTYANLPGFFVSTEETAPTGVEEGPKPLSNKLNRKFSMAAFDRKLLPEIQKLDKDGDGFLDFEEIEEAVLLLVKHRENSAMLMRTVFLLIVFLFVLLGSTFVLVYVVVDMQKVFSHPDSSNSKHLPDFLDSRMSKPTTDILWTVLLVLQ